jgi:hypothetical protein
MDITDENQDDDGNEAIASASQGHYIDRRGQTFRLHLGQIASVSFDAFIDAIRGRVSQNLCTVEQLRMPLLSCTMHCLLIYVLQHSDPFWNKQREIERMIE